MTHETLLTERHGRVLLVRLNRPESLNALNAQVARDLIAVTAEADADEDIGCVVLTGSDRAFAAGADIKEMLTLTFQDVAASDMFAEWGLLTGRRKPIIAAVAGYALGGGCELAMMCDFILAADTAKFGQPEIKLGTIPGMGGSQRLARFVGKSKTMEMVLTGRLMDATEAAQCGLVSRVVPADTLVAEALRVAEGIAGLSAPVVAMAKDAVNRAFETTLAEGLVVERRIFHSTFALDDRAEGMAAFAEKRKPAFRNR
ncbi:enoyl-CoA hydratase [Rhodobacter sp. Har01]|uniref:enoyl-CoA hydratase n=1 Tax=Rhodobacter sp. Har01 TaxID=2883999 RepID=UPI001D05E87B|nr:enoyl-CoA hydratase [Rhodobacter sp. Har01]MCB6176938.1 enoyl-CoA hydratase [Rhodobacter sp. Har01]